VTCHRLAGGGLATLSRYGSIQPTKLRQVAADQSDAEPAHSKKEPPFRKRILCAPGYTPINAAGAQVPFLNVKGYFFTWGLTLPQPLSNND
jgi:hypothetical protein